MKKSILLILTILSFNISVSAKEKLMVCTYDAKIIDLSTYIRYRITYYDDETINKEIVNGSDYTKFVDSNVKMHSNVSTFNVKDNKQFTSILTVGDSFSAEVMKKYYEKKVCPYIAFNYENFNISPQEDTSLNGVAYSTNVSEGKTELFDYEGNEETPNIPKVVTSCDYHITTDKSIPDVDGFTINFSMYDNGKKYFKVFLNKDGEAKAQNIEVTNTGAVGRLENNKGHTYTIVLPANEVSNIYEQKNAAQVNNNNFACPSPNSIFLIEESYTEGSYKLTTSEDEANEYNNSSNLQEGVGQEGSSNPGGVTTNTNLNFTVNGECSSLLGSPEHKENPDPAYYLQFTFNLIKYIALVVLFVFTVLEFGKATASSSPDAMKKAINSTVKRLIIAVIIFFLPILIEFVLRLLGVYSANTCGIS
ncbi:MAG: hypothetical protein NC483_00040 [Ruminococcus sp.]|nr:hypothetical protein [Ruminococcus sp.]